MTDAKLREVSMCSQSYGPLNSKYLWFVPSQRASLDVGADVTKASCAQKAAYTITAHWRKCTEICESQIALKKGLKDAIEWLEIGQCERLRALEDRLCMHSNNYRLAALV
jgi:hypothetical protein